MFSLPLWQFSVIGAIELGDGTDRRTVNSIGYRWEPSDPGLPATDLIHWDRLFFGPWAGVVQLLPADWECTSIQLRELRPGVDQSTTEPAFNVFGGTQGPYTTPNICVHANLWTANRGRAFRGFKRLGPVPLSEIAGNQLSPEALNAWGSRIDDLIQPLLWRTIGTVDYYLVPVVWERLHETAFAFENATGNCYDITSATVAPLLSTVRRRRSLAKS